MLAMAVREHPAPEKTKPKEATATVRVITLPSVTIVPVLYTILDDFGLSVAPAPQAAA